MKKGVWGRAVATIRILKYSDAREWAEQKRDAAQADQKVGRYYWHFEQHVQRKICYTWGTTSQY